MKALVIVFHSMKLELTFINYIDTLGHVVSASGHLSHQSLLMENMINASTPQQPQSNVLKGSDLYNYTVQVMQSIRSYTCTKANLHIIFERVSCKQFERKQS